MSQQVKIRRKLTIKGEMNFSRDTTFEGVRIITKAANYSINATVDSGAYIAADNSAQMIYFNLPAVNACNGFYWNFFAANTGKFQIVGDTNAVVSDYGVATKAINFGHGKEGEGGRVICNGTKYYLVGVNPSASTLLVNASYQQG